MTLPTSSHSAIPSGDMLDPVGLMRVLSCLDDDVLEAVEDDLDLYHFSGLMSGRLKSVLDAVETVTPLAA